MPQPITSQKLIKALKSLGFVEKARKGSHMLLEHPDHKQRVALPVTSTTRQLPLSIVTTIKKVITEAGVVSEEDFDLLIKK